MRNNRQTENPLFSESHGQHQIDQASLAASAMLLSRSSKCKIGALDLDKYPQYTPDSFNLLSLIEVLRHTRFLQPNETAEGGE